MAMVRCGALGDGGREENEAERVSKRCRQQTAVLSKLEGARNRVVGGAAARRHRRRLSDIWRATSENCRFDLTKKLSAALSSDIQQ